MPTLCYLAHVLKMRSLTAVSRRIAIGFCQQARYTRIYERCGDKPGKSKMTSWNFNELFCPGARFGFNQNTSLEDMAMQRIDRAQSSPRFGLGSRRCCYQAVLQHYDDLKRINTCHLKDEFNSLFSDLSKSSRGSRQSSQRFLSGTYPKRELLSEMPSYIKPNGISPSWQPYSGHCSNGLVAGMQLS